MGLISLHELAGLGQGSECGPQPELKTGEKAKCCPGVGWVVYDSFERETGLCDRAAGGGGPSAPSLPSTSGSGGSDFEARMAAIEERRFQRETQTMIMRAQLEHARAQKARLARAQSAKAAAAAAAEKAKADAKRAEETRKALSWGAVALIAAKALAFF